MLQPESSKRILVTGAGGALGNALLSMLASAGWNIRALVLPGTVAMLAGASETVVGDVRSRSDMRHAVQGVDAVLHMASVILSRDPSVFAEVNREGTRNLLTACQEAGVSRFVQVSSISVEYPSRTVYAESKFQAEALVRESSLDWSIVRPTLLVGKGGGAEYHLFKQLASWPVAVLPAGGFARKRPIHVADLAESLTRLMGAGSQTFGKTYALAGLETLTLKEMLTGISRDQGGSGPFLLPLPQVLARAGVCLADLLPGRAYSASQALAGLVQNAAPDTSAATLDFGHCPRPLAGRWLH